MVFDASGPLKRRILRVSKAEGSNLLTLDLLVESVGGLIKMKRAAGELAGDRLVVMVVAGVATALR